MGSFAVDIDWKRPITGRVIDSMLARAPHRARGRSARMLSAHAALGETRSRSPACPEVVAAFGRFTIVGDLRLWVREGLRSRAGGLAATKGLSDRQLLLAAYARTGIGFLDDLDGDFAFVIWDDERCRALAVRDRFAVKPLFFAKTPTGIRLASQPKQLLAASTAPAEPCDRMVVEFLTEQHQSTHLTFFEGVQRVRPAEYVVFGEGVMSRASYWSPTFATHNSGAPTNIADAFRSRLVDAVGHRLASSDGVVAHLTGGLDSSSITAAASDIAARSSDVPPFHTVSAVFPGYEADESQWIDAIATRQLFPHLDFEPSPGTIDRIAAAMYQTDGPLVNRVRGLLSGTAEIAGAVGADLVLMGSGGDEVLDQEQLLADLLRSRLIGRWLTVPNW